MSLLLTIDAGNTNTVLGVHEGAELRAHWRLTTRREQTADEYGILVRNLFAASGVDPRRIEGVALASVVPPLTPVLVDAVARSTWARSRWWWSPACAPACRSSTSRPATWAPTASSTAWPRFAAYGGPVIVVDFGTATTFDVVTRKGEYVGRRDLPGRRHQRRRALPARGAAAARGRAQPGPRDRPLHRRLDPVRALLRLRGDGGGHHRRASAPSWASRRAWWPPAAWPRRWPPTSRPSRPSTPC